MVHGERTGLWSQIQVIRQFGARFALASVSLTSYGARMNCSYTIKPVIWPVLELRRLKPLCYKPPVWGQFFLAYAPSSAENGQVGRL